MRRPAVAFIASALVVTGAALEPVAAATRFTPYDVASRRALEPQSRGRWGERLAAAGDLDGDGVPDLFAAAPQQDVGGMVDAGRVYLLSGVNRAAMMVIDSPEPQASAKFGFFINVLGDVDGDGEDDLVVGTDAQDVYTGAGPACGEPEPNGCNEDQGKAWVFSGATGEVIHALDNPLPQGAPGNSARFGSRLGRAGDVTGDGTPDVIAGASNNDVPPGCGDVTPVPEGCRKNEGQAFIFDGATGALVRTLDPPLADRVPAAPCSSGCGSFGLAVQGPGDTNGDGVTDQLVMASYNHYTGTGAACGAPEPNGCNESQGRMYVFSGATGQLLRSIDNPDPQAGANFGFQDAAPLSPGDVNGDGRADLYANGFGQDGPTGLSEGRAWVFDGATGELLYELRDPSPSAGGQFGWSLARTEFDDDGVPDLYIGSSPHHVAGSVQHGGTYVFDGRSGTLLKAFELPDEAAQPWQSGNLGPNLGWGLAAIGDVNGDGDADFAAAAPFWDGATRPDEGVIFAFLSDAAGTPRCRGVAATIVGTAGADVLEGGPSRDVVVAGSGDDVVKAGGGGDVICGGRGGDVLRGGAGDDVAAGGDGADRLLGGRGQDLLLGNDGTDDLDGGDGRDECRGGAARDRIVRCEG